MSVRLPRALLRAVWRLWLRFAEMLGNAQMMVVLSLAYWVVIAAMAVPFRLLSDPLSLRRTRRVRWMDRPAGSTTMEAMRKQY